MGSFRTCRNPRDGWLAWRHRAAVWAVLLHLAASTAVGQVPYRRIAKTGDPVPGLPGAVFDSIGVPAIDASGDIALRATMEGPGITVTNDQAIFHGKPGNLNMVIRERDLLPQFGDGVYSRAYSYPFASQTGEIGISAKLDGTRIGSGFDDVIFTWSRSGFQLVAREGNTPPDVTDGGVYNGSLSSSAMGRSGHVAYRAAVGEAGYIGIPDQSGLWAGTPDNPRLVARTGGQPPGTAPGVYFSLNAIAATFTVNRRGAIAFPALIDGPGVDASNNAGIWAGTHADLGLVMRAGDPAPLPERGARFIGEPPYALINGNDRVLFPAFLTGKGIHGANSYGLWAGSAGGHIQLIARNGDAVPKLGSDYTITNIYPFMQTEDDRVVIVTTFTGPAVTPENDQAILFGKPGNWDLLFREGEQAPGLPKGVVLEFTDGPIIIAIVESGAGGMLLGLGGNDVSEGNDEALVWRRSESDPWQFVAREGELFDGSVVRDGGLSLLPSSGGSGVRPNVNDRGDLVFLIRFEGESPNDVSGAYLVPTRPAIAAVASDVRIR